jgi:hypothetical protein
MADLEDALKKLDRLTQEEARMAHAEVLRITHNIRNEVKIVDGKVEGVGDKVEEVGDKVGDKVQCVDEKVQVVIEGAWGLSSPLETILTSILSDGKQANLIIRQTANGVDEIKCSCLPFNLSVACCSRLDLPTGNQWKQLLRTWLSPADPSTNHNIARKAQYTGTAAWLFQGQIIIKWKSTGSLLWVHGKRVFVLLCPASRHSNRLQLLAGSGKSVIWFIVPPPPSCRNLFILR